MSFQNPVFIPGPDQHSRKRAQGLRHADARPPLAPLSRGFSSPAVAGVRRVLKMAEGEVIILPSTGTGGWEAAISNTLSPPATRCWRRGSGCSATAGSIFASATG